MRFKTKAVSAWTGSAPCGESLCQDNLMTRLHIRGKLIFQIRKEVIL